MAESRPDLEPIAIVGIGCRFPGEAHSAHTFWSLLIEGRSGIRDVPADRWNVARYYHSDPAAPGAMVMRRGGFVDQLDGFDAAFWGVSRREAVRMDPQQRWLLEVAWEAMEDAGIAPSRLRGRRVAVFVGISGNDYGGLQLRSTEQVDAYTNSGSTASIASNRVSYMLDLRGPSVSLDTACSSSLVAVALACESLWFGHCEGALAGGVNALISPQTSVGFSKASMISPTGDCFAFDARANGFVRAEGAALVYLKPLSAAIAGGDRVYAVIRAAVVNQDGHTSSMTVPGVDGQAAMLEEAYRLAGITPVRVGYVEAHGTGTPVGDPIEAAALGRVLGRDRPPDRKCLIGSVKTNIGHLEAGSGIAGLIKAALVLHHRTIPATLNYERPNPAIAFDDLGLAVASRRQPLPSLDGHLPAVAVNSFGFGGTNAHAVLEAAPQPVSDGRAAAPSPALDRPHLLPISARDETALRVYVQGYRELLRNSPHTIGDVCGSAGNHKDHHQHRLVFIGPDRVAIRRRMAAWLRDGAAEGVIGGRPGLHPQTAPVFVFAGQGPQWWGMGRQLLEREPVFRDTMRDLDAAIEQLTGWSVLAELQRAETESQVDRTDIAQPAIFALQVALVALWNSWGIRPAKAIGHSMGEVTAAYCAGVYSLANAIRIITTRGRLQHKAFGGGRMLAVALSADEARAAIGSRGEVELAAINSPRLMTLAGRVEPLQVIERQLQQAGVFTRWLRGGYAFHSAQMDVVRDDVLEALAAIAPERERIPLISTVTGAPIAGDSLDAMYWWQNIRQAVLFGPALAASIEQGDRTFLEIGPHPVLESSIKECLGAQAKAGAVFHSLRREADESAELMTNLAGLHVSGVDVDWKAVNQSMDTVRDQPPYPWTRESFWIESADSSRLRLAPAAHPLLGQRIESAIPTWQLTFDLSRFDYVKDHRVRDSVVFPAAAYLEMGLALARILFPTDSHAVENLEIKKALFLSEQDPVVLQTTFNADDKSFQIHSATTAAGPWELHAHGVLSRMASRSTVPAEFEAIRAHADDSIDHGTYREELAARGFQFGPAFTQVRHLWRRGAEVLAEIVPPASIAEASREYVFHPAIQDACFHAFVGFRPPAGEYQARALFLPQSVGRLHVHGVVAPRRLWAHAVATTSEDSSFCADIHVYDDEGQRVADILGFRMTAVEHKHSRRPFDDCYYQFAWQPARLRGSGAHGPCAFAPSGDIAAAVAAALPDVEQRHHLDEYHQRFVAGAESVAGLLTERALALLWRPQVGDRASFDQLVEALGIVPEYHRVARRLFRHLETTGVLRSLGDELWEVARIPDGSGAERAMQALAERHPGFAAEVELFRRTGLNLAGILTGELDPLELLFPAGSQDCLERYYAEALGFPAHLELTRVAVERAIAALPARRALRVLEIGAGTGALTRALLPVLPLHGTEYLFTDIGGGFVAAARKRFADVPFLEFQQFDLEADPERQQIPSGYFDLIVGADVVHATADLRVSLRHLRQCLAPGGLVVLLELAKPDFVRDSVTFGLLAGYSRFRDTDVRPDSALVTSDQWRHLLTQTGFSDVRAIPCYSDAAAAEHSIVIGFAPPAAPSPRNSERPRLQYLVLADEGGLGAAVIRVLRERGYDLAAIDRADAGDVSAVLAAAAARQELAGVIHCWSLVGPDPATLTLEQLRSAQDSGSLSAFDVIRALADTPARAWFITRHAHRVTASDLVQGLAASPLSGILRVANNEHQCRFSTIDLDDCSPDAAAGCVADEVTLPGDGEFEVAFRGGVRHALRLQPVTAEQLPRRLFNANTGGGVVPFRLETHGPGILSNLALHETERLPVGPDQVEVRVHAAGINFRDVMKALGTHPGNPVDLLWFGDDLAGTVERVGHEVTHLRPGDEVAGMAPYAFRSYARTDARMLFAKPHGLSFAQAAAIPTIFLTAHYAIEHLARMQPGESILIHAATGGVGQAALEIARHRKLTVFATAGTPEKRQILREMGVKHVMSSRTLDFADEVLRATGGRGVDAVLNSLAGDFIPKSLSVVAPFGRFLEIGKVDVYRNTKIGLHPLRNNVSYFVIDLTQHLRDKPALVAQLFREIGACFATGAYQPVPLSLYTINDAADAFRSMAQGKHVGKNVLTFDHDVIPIACTTEPTHRFTADATYLITGGAGGFGLEVAGWIARHGGRHLALMSRSGPRDDRARQTIEQLRADGVTVYDGRGDVANSEDVQRLIRHIERELPPLKGVFHAAMVLDDDAIMELDERRVWNALAPKMLGAWNLHLATERCPLEHFVCFSSFSAVMGMLRQANYNAGNAFLDALAHYRRARNLPALTVNWGAIRGAGYVDRDQKTAETLEKLGLGALDKEEALQVLDELLVRDAGNVVAARADWSAVLKVSPLAARSRAYASVTRETGGADHGRSLDARLRGATADDQVRVLEDFIAGQVAGVFGAAEDRIDRAVRLTDLGLDSLMTLELTNRVERELGIRLPVGSLLSGPTITELARSVRELLVPALSETPASPAGTAPSAPPQSPEAHAVVAASTGDAQSWSGDPRDHVVVVKNGSDVPVFCFHPVGGGVGIYAGLSPHLPDTVALYGIESRLVRGATSEYAELHDMVEAYVTAVRRTHRGPYRLLGFSLGGYLAAHVAGALERLGEQVALVGVLDWDARQQVTPAAQREALVRLCMASYLFLQQEMGMLRPLATDRLHDDICTLVDRVARESSGGGDVFFRWVVENELTTSKALEELARQYLVRFEQHCRLLSRGLPRPEFGAPLIIWRARDGFGSALETWERDGGLTEEHVFDGDHNALMRPAVLERVAVQLFNFMRASERVAPTPSGAMPSA